MVRRLPLTALVAVLAVALPASAEGDPSASSASGSTAPECTTFDLACMQSPSPCDLFAGLCATSASAGSILLGPYGSAADSHCSLWDLNMPDNNQPIEETVILDPGGCYRRFIRETLDELPMWHTAVQVQSSAPLSNLSWP